MILLCFRLFRRQSYDKKHHSQKPKLRLFFQKFPFLWIIAKPETDEQHAESAAVSLSPSVAKGN